MHKYKYEGPVFVFGQCVQDRYVAESIAESAKKARSNIAYNWKRKNNRVASSKVSLPGSIFVIDVEEEYE